MIHIRALIEIACKILGLMFLIWGINASAFIPVGWLMRPDEEETEQMRPDEEETEQMRPDEEETEQMIQDEEKIEWMIQDEEEEEDEIIKMIAIYKRITMPILYFVFAFVFFKYADTITQQLGRKNWYILISSHDDWPQVLYNLGILLIGFYMVAFKGVPRVIDLGISVFSFQKISLVPTHIWLNAIALLAYLALGFYLLAGGSLVAKLKNIVNQADN